MALGGSLVELAVAGTTAGAIASGAIVAGQLAGAWGTGYAIGSLIDHFLGDWIYDHFTCIFVDDCPEVDCDSPIFSDSPYARAMWGHTGAKW